MIGPKVAGRFLTAIVASLTVVSLVACAPAAPSSPAAQPPARQAAAQQPATQKPAAQQPTQQQAAAPQAPKEVKIGLVYPLTGSMGPVGQEFVAAHKLAADIVNNKFDLNLPLAREEGLPNLGGAKITLVTADSQGDPETGRAETERFISQDKPVVVIGAYQSAVTKTASLAAERAGIPFVNASSTSPDLTDRGLKWFFRVTPHDTMFINDTISMLKDMNDKKNAGIKTVALLNEDSEAGAQMTTMEKDLVPKAGFNLVLSLTYHSGTTDLTSEVLRLKSANPDVVISNAYTPDVILLVKTLKEMGYMPKMIAGQRGGYTSYDTVKAIGADYNFVSTTNVWAPDLAKTNPLLKAVNDMFVQRTGKNLTAESSRAITAMLVVADAINRAKSTDSEAIYNALLQTNIPKDQLIVPWDGVQFDQKTHQNTKGRGIITQVQNGDFVTVWPFESAASQIVYPAPTWDKR